MEDKYFQNSILALIIAWLIAGPAGVACLVVLFLLFVLYAYFAD